MNIYPQAKPNAVQIEATEGCSLACSFCGIQSIRANGASFKTGTHGTSSGPYRFMDLNTAARIAEECARLGWQSSRFEFAMHGEPTMNKLLPDFILLFRTMLGEDAYIQVTTNGSGLVSDPAGKLNALFAAGVNTVALDNYKHADFVPRILDATIGFNVKPVFYPEDPSASPHERHKGKKLVVIHDISENTTGNHQLTNQGCASGVGEKVDQRCAKPFRELSIRWDGNVAICCDDWRGQYKIGNVHDMALDEIWLHPRFEAARRRLYAKRRDFGPCRGCNVRSHRTGLLPDKFGKDSMDAPDAESDAFIAEAVAGAPFTPLIRKD